MNLPPLPRAEFRGLAGSKKQNTSLLLQNVHCDEDINDTLRFCCLFTFCAHSVNHKQEKILNIFRVQASAAL